MYCPSSTFVSDAANETVLKPKSTNTIGVRQHKEAINIGNPVRLNSSFNFMPLW